MKEKIKNGKERLEFIVGANIEDIKKEVNNIVFPDSREIIELRYGINDGIEHTIDEIVKILNKKEISPKELREYKKDKKYAQQFGIELNLNVWTNDSVIENLAGTLQLLINKYHPNRFDWPKDVDVKENVTSEVERLECLLKSNIDKIRETIDNLLQFQTKDIIEMHYGLNGKVYTLKDIVNILNNKKISNEDRRLLEKYKEIEFLCDFKYYQDNLTMEKVRKEEANAILRLRQYLLND